MIKDRFLETIEFIGRHRECMGHCILVWSDGYRVLVPQVEGKSGIHTYAVHPYTEVLESDNCTIMEFSL